MIKKRDSISSGMTLNELIVVVTILAMLMVLAMLASRSQIFKGMDARRKTDIYQIKVAVEEYEKDNDCYPPALPACDPGTGLQPYIPKIPCDPQDKTNYFYVAQPNTSCPSWYWIFTPMDNKHDPQIEKLGCTQGCGPTVETAVYDYFATSPSAPDPAKGTDSEDPPEAPSGYFGCIGGSCMGINFKPPPNEHTLECAPNFTDINCGGKDCSDPMWICTPQ